MSKEEDKGVHGRAEEFLQVFKKGAEFTQELLKENERLRYRILQLEESQSNQEGVPPASDENRRLFQRIEELEREKEEILGRIKHVEAENQDFAARYIEIEEENNNLANLYIASYQLHSTLDFKEVLQIITEIIINLIGAEEFAVMLLDEKSNEIQAVASEGIQREDIPHVKFGKGIIGEVAKTTLSRTSANMFVTCINRWSVSRSRSRSMSLEPWSFTSCCCKNRTLPQLTMNYSPYWPAMRPRLFSVPGSITIQSASFQQFRDLLNS